MLGLFDKSGGKVVEYVYDSWGKLISTTGSKAGTVGAANPFRYRGYYYDSESGLYYLNSRYYDPETGRFVNADGVLGANQDLLGYNLFAYCSNNPVNMADPDGDEAVLAFLLISAGILIAADIISGASSQRAEAFLKNPTPRNTLNWLTSGTTDMMYGAVCPEKPLSLEHWMDSLGTASLLYGAGKGIKSKTPISYSKPSGSKLASNPLQNIKYTDKVKVQMELGDYHSFPKIVDNYGAMGKIENIVGGDGITRTRVSIPGEYRGKTGIFEYIIDPEGSCNHRLFR